MDKESKNKILVVTIFAIAMGFLEAAIVIYLRRLFYPTTIFSFPLVGFLTPSLIAIEWPRGIATIIMLITIAMLASKKIQERFAYFIYAFGVWDICYYIFLKVALNWPSSILTWDLLFLFPLPWVGPVLTPCLVSIMFITLAIILINSENSKVKKGINKKEWALILTGALLVLYTWIYDYGKIILQGGFLKDFLLLINNPEFMTITSNYSPNNYNWPVFIAGYIISAVGILLFYIRTKPYSKIKRQNH